MNGSETVDTSSATTYSKEFQKISFSALQVGDVVHVAGMPVPTGSSGSAASPPAPPGTGTVKAAEVTVVEPRFVGRLLSKAADGTWQLVGQDGRLLTVETTGSTRYYQGTTQTTASAISVGSHVMAEGSRTGVTRLTAAVITLAPAPPAEGPAAPGSAG